MAEGRKPAHSGRRNKARAGPPVLVLFDPGDQGINIEYSDPDSVKLWVMNRIHIYYCEDGSNWIHGFGNFEGILSSPVIYSNNKQKYRDFYSVQSSPPQVHFTAVPPPETDMKKRFNDYGISSTVVEPVNTSIMRPYPEGFNEKQAKFFGFGFFKKGIKVLKIPSRRIIYPLKYVLLSYWESYFYQYSDNEVIKKLKAKEVNSEPWEPGDREKLTEAIEKKLGTRIVTLVKESTGFSLVPGYKDVGDAGVNLFAFGMTEDVAQSKTGANKLPSQGEGHDQNSLSGQLQLYQLPPGTKLGFPSEWFKQFNYSHQKKLLQSFSNAKESITDKDILLRIKEYLKENFDSDTAWELSKHFHIAYEDTEPKCILLAIAAALESWRISLSSYHSDLSASKQFNRNYIISAKEFRFATGSDAYSNGVVPVHIYMQVKNWWDNLYSYQRDEIENEVVQVEVIGYASNTPDEADNERLRDDRAWKTAKALELVLTDSGFKRELKLVPIPVSSAVMPNEPTTEDKNKLPILYVGEKTGMYPNRKLLKQEGNYVMDLPGDTKLSEIKTGTPYSDDQEDRISLVIFKRLIPEDVDQVVKNVIISNTASPVYSYYTIFSTKTSDEYRKVVYVCPGEFKI